MFNAKVLVDGFVLVSVFWMVIYVAIPAAPDDKAAKGSKIVVITYILLAVVAFLMR